MDIEKTAEDLNGKIEFVSSLAKADDKTTEWLYELPEGVKAVVYLPESGFSADELAVFDCGSAENVEAAKASIEKHLEDVKETFINYLPDEAAKAENAVIEVKNEYIILCITSDETSQSTIRKAME